MGGYPCLEVVLRRCSEKKTVLKNFEKFIGKHLLESLFDKEAG